MVLMPSRDAVVVVSSIVLASCRDVDHIRFGGIS